MGIFRRAHLGMVNGQPHIMGTPNKNTSYMGISRVGWPKMSEMTQVLMATQTNPLPYLVEGTPTPKLVDAGAGQAPSH